MSEEKIVNSVTVRSSDSKNKRLCDIGFDSNGSIYIIDVENDRSGKKKYIACIDSYVNELIRMMQKNRMAI